MIDAVVKVGGALLEREGALAHVLAALERAASEHTLLIVPGGGPFADVVRTVDKHHSLSADDAHWMAILGMEQFAILLASRMRGAELVQRRTDIARAHVRGAVPVLAPYRWLRQADPLPHSWEVTSDSIAVWVAAQVGARRLILIKPSAHDVLTVVDRHFRRVLPAAMTCSVLTPDMLTERWFPA